MLPGKKYSPDDIVRQAWRRKWFIVLPFLVVSAATPFSFSRAAPIAALESFSLRDTMRTNSRSS